MTTTDQTPYGPTPLDAWHLAEQVASFIDTVATLADPADLRRSASVLRATSASARATAYADALDLAASLAEQAQPVVAALAEVAL